LKVDGSDKVKMYASSSWASRGFCTECGTHLFFKFNQSGDYNIPVGIFKNLPGFEIDIQYLVINALVFIASRIKQKK